jgi:hypothetical protein
MQQFNVLILPGCFVLTALIFVAVGYWMGRKTVTDVPLIERKFNPKDGKEPEQDEVMRCLHGNEK